VLIGKEAALFVSSGTQGNLISCLIHCRERGSEMILGDKAHIHTSEGGGSAMLGGIHSRTVATRDDGTLDLNEIKSKIRPLADDHAPVTKLICLENTHNRSVHSYATRNTLMLLFIVLLIIVMVVVC
jgi:threonine aldolase